MSRNNVFTSPPTVCPECGGVDAHLIKAVPAHTRTWSVVEDKLRQDFTENCGPAYDMSCGNCDHEWTSYQEQEESALQVHKISKLDVFSVSAVNACGEPIKDPEPAEDKPVTVSAGETAFGGFQVISCAENVDSVLLALKGLGARLTPTTWAWYLDTRPNAKLGDEGLAKFPYSVYYGPRGHQVLVGYCSHEMKGAPSARIWEDLHGKA